jgi:hypothetical protein
MKYGTCAFRNADRLLPLTEDWPLLMTALEGLTIRKVERAQLADGKKRKGAQSALNSVFRKLLPEKAGWVHEARLFPLEPGSNKDERKVDFVSPTRILGVEIALNNRSYLPGTVMRLNLAAEAEGVLAQHAIAGGVVVVPTKRLHSWGSMDPTVPDFDIAVRWIRLMQHSFSIPLMLAGIGTDADVPDGRSSLFGDDRNK